MTIFRLGEQQQGDSERAGVGVSRLTLVEGSTAATGGGNNGPATTSFPSVVLRLRPCPSRAPFGDAPGDFIIKKPPRGGPWLIARPVHVDAQAASAWGGTAAETSAASSSSSSSLVHVGRSIANLANRDPDLLEALGSIALAALAPREVAATSSLEGGIYRPRNPPGASSLLPCE